MKTPKVFSNDKPHDRNFNTLQVKGASIVEVWDTEWRIVQNAIQREISNHGEEIYLPVALLVLLVEITNKTLLYSSTNVHSHIFATVHTKL